MVHSADGSLGGKTRPVVTSLLEPTRRNELVSVTELFAAGIGGAPLRTDRPLAAGIGGAPLRTDRPLAAGIGGAPLRAGQPLRAGNRRIPRPEGCVACIQAGGRADARPAANGRSNRAAVLLQWVTWARGVTDATDATDATGATSQARSITPVMGPTPVSSSGCSPKPTAVAYWQPSSWAHRRSTSSPRQRACPPTGSPRRSASSSTEASSSRERTGW